MEAATAATKAKGTYLRDKFYRLKARRGYKRAVVAVAHKILVAIYHILSHQVCYNELRDLYLNKLNKHSLTRNVVHRLERLGYTVTLEQKGRMNSVALAYAGCPAEPYFQSSRSRRGAAPRNDEKRLLMKR